TRMSERSPLNGVMRVSQALSSSILNGTAGFFVAELWLPVVGSFTVAPSIGLCCAGFLLVFAQFLSGDGHAMDLIRAIGQPERPQASPHLSQRGIGGQDRKSTRLNSSHVS